MLFTKMNGYELSRQWWDFAFANPEKVKPIHSALYFFAIENCNRMGWAEKFRLPSEMAMSAIGVHSYKTYIAALKDLCEWGFLIMVQKSQNQYSANIVALVNFTKAQDKALDKALAKHIPKQVQSTDQSIASINKQETINDKQQKKGRASLEDCRAYALQVGYKEEMGNVFFDGMESKGWKVGKGPCRDWEAAFRNWAKKDWNLQYRINQPETKAPSRPIVTADTKLY